MEGYYNSYWQSSTKIVGGELKIHRNNLQFSQIKKPSTEMAEG